MCYQKRFRHRIVLLHIGSNCVSPHLACALVSDQLLHALCASSSAPLAMSDFERARARIGGARLILQDVRRKDHAIVSKLQSNALIELLRSDSTQLLSVEFLEDQRSAILSLLRNDQLKHEQCKPKTIDLIQCGLPHTIQYT